MQYLAAAVVLAIVTVAALAGRWTGPSIGSVGGGLALIPGTFAGWLMVENFAPYVTSVALAVAVFVLVAGVAGIGAAAGRSRRHHVERSG